jgi:hypothetical protein
MSQMQHYISRAKTVQGAPEQDLPAIMSRSYYQNKEQIARPMLQRLAQQKMAQNGGNRTQINVDYQVLEKDSNIRRNHLVLEDVVRQREREQWLEYTSAEIHDRCREQAEALRQQMMRQMHAKSYNLNSEEQL